MMFVMRYVQGICIDSVDRTKNVRMLYLVVREGSGRL